MILLFNKVYLRADASHNTNGASIIVSGLMGRSAIIDQHFSAVANNRQVVLPLYQTLNVDALFAEAGSPDAFFDVLVKFNADTRLTVVCDAPAMFTLASKFWKTLYPSLPDDMFYTLLNFTFSQLVEMVGTGYTSFGVTSDASAEKLRTDYAWYLANQNRAEVMDMWHDISPWLISRTVRETLLKTCAVEFQLASIVVDPAWRYNAIVKSKIVKMIRKECIHEYMRDVKYALLAGLMNFEQFDAEVTFDPFTQSLEEFVLLYPKYRFLTDNRFVPDESTYVCGTYDFEELGVIGEKVTMGQHRYGISWLPLMKNNLSYDDIIKYELSTPTTKLFLNRYAFEETVNPYFIDFIFDSLRVNQIDKLLSLKLF